MVVPSTNWILPEAAVGDSLAVRVNFCPAGRLVLFAESGCCGGGENRLDEGSRRRAVVARVTTVNGGDLVPAQGQSGGGERGGSAAQRHGTEYRRVILKLDAPGPADGATDAEKITA